MRKTYLSNLSFGGALLLMSSGAWAGSPATRPSDLTNLVRNPSFEQRAGDKIEAWTIQYRAKDADPRQVAELKERVVFSQSESACAGNYAGRVTMNALPPKIGFALVEQIIPVRPNTRYYFSAMVKSEGGGWNSITLVPRTAQGKEAVPTAGKAGDMLIPEESTGEYVKVQHQLQTGPDAAALSIQLRAWHGNRRVDYDDLKLLEIPDE